MVVKGLVSGFVFGEAACALRRGHVICLSLATLMRGREFGRRGREVRSRRVLCGPDRVGSGERRHGVLMTDQVTFPPGSAAW
jgi:hypothetical protein